MDMSHTTKVVIHILIYQRQVPTSFRNLILVLRHFRRVAQHLVVQLLRHMIGNLIIILTLSSPLTDLNVTEWNKTNVNMNEMKELTWFYYFIWYILL